MPIDDSVEKLEDYYLQEDQKNHLKDVIYTFDDTAHSAFVKYHDELCDRNY